MLPVFNMSYRPKSELFVLKGGVLWFKSKPQGSIYLHTIWSSKNIDQALKLGTFYRVPTLNEMYWNPGGNSELKTEQALGLKYTFKFDKILNFRFTTDQSIVSNLIQWTPGASGYWTPENQKRVYLGTSSAILSRRFGSWEIGGNATHNLSKILRSEQPNDPSIGKMLIYRPVLQSIATVEYRWDKSSVQFRYNHVGKRYTLRDNDLSGILSSEDWLNFSYNTIISSHIRLSARIENVFNASRQQMIYYPLPGRYYSIQLLINDLKK
jgi:iron complex outermembrane receptor protein